MSSIARPRSLALAIGSALSLSATQAAVITVNTLADPGSSENCSLRSAIETLRTQTQVDGCYGVFNGENDSIEFADGLSGTIALDYGQLIIDASMSINGPGSDVITIDAGGYSRVARIGGGASVSISGLTLTGGNAYFGAGLYIVGSDVQLSDCVLTGNQASSFGGAIEVFEFSTLNVDGCTISDNQAANGGGIAVTSGSALIQDSIISGNIASGTGGGLWVRPQTPGYGPRGGYGGSYAELQADSSLITANSAFAGGGIGAGYANSEGPFGADRGLSGLIQQFRQSSDRFSVSRGGPPPTSDVNLTVTDSIVSLNEATFGGGIGMYGGAKYSGRQSNRGYYYGYTTTNTLISTGNTLSNNQALLGGGMGAKYGFSTVQDTSITDNIAALGGGGIANVGSADSYGGPLGDDRGLISPFSGELLMLDSIVSGNNVVGFDGRGSYYATDYLGGGVFNMLSTAEIENSAITGNSTADVGGGIASLAGITLIAYGEISANDGGGVLSGYYSQFAGFATRIEDNGQGPVGGLACEMASTCFVKYSSVSGNEGTIAGGIGADLGVLNLYEPVGWSQPDASGRGNGGGSSSSVLVSSATVSGNEGGVFGGIGAPDLMLAHSTIAFNSAESGPLGSERGFYVNSGGVTTLSASSITHSILANNSSPYASDLLVYGNNIDMDYSLVEDPQGFNPLGDGNILDADPVLGPLDFNGSIFSRTHALLTGSPAIDAGDADISEAPTYDQRGPGFPRIIGGVIDIGAYEAEGLPPTIPELGLSDSEIDFGAVRVGQQGGATLTLTSTGTGPVTIGNITLGPARGLPAAFSIDSDDCSGVTLPVDDSCEVELLFNPGARALFDGSLSVPSDDPDSPALVELSGQGIAPVLAIAPDEIDFGAVEIGSQVLGQVSLSNVGDDLLTLDSVAVAAPFAAVSGEAGFCFETMSTTLAAGASCNLRFTFAPQAEGSFAEMAQIQSDSLGGDDSVSLLGSGFEGDEPPPPPEDDAIPVPVMGHLATLLLGGGLMLLGWLGLRRRRV